MSLFCMLGAHRPSLSSILRREGGLTSVCEGCERLLVKAEYGGKWEVAAPLVERFKADRTSV